MRRILLALMSTVAAVVMLFGYRTSTPNSAGTAATTVAAAAPPSSPTAGAPSSSPTAGAPSSSPTVTVSPSTGTTTGGPSSDSAKTVAGQTAQTRWGPVKVQVTVTSGKITAVTVLQQPSSNARDVQINNAALPVLKRETLQAQSAKIDSVSGATYTSQGYLRSLQSGLDQAGL